MKGRRMNSPADPHPFALIPEPPKHHARFHIVARIPAEESKLVEHLGGINRDP
jgi:hypothetical protein